MTLLIDYSCLKRNAILKYIRAFNIKLKYHPRLSSIRMYISHQKSIHQN